MGTHRHYGLGLALLGALVLTPDALFMRWSGMNGFQMLGWRGLCMGALFLLAWGLTSKARSRDLPKVLTRAGITVVLCQFFNALLFPMGIGGAPVAPVLLGVATVPVWAALLARLLHNEATPPATWATIAAVLAGITLAITGKGDLALNPGALFGAACGLGVAFALALNFVTLRHAPDLPLLLAIGGGALLAGCTGLAITTPARMTDGNVAAILLTGLVILPLAFFSLSQASRHTAAANVSLLLLLETVLAPIWVWLGTGEAPTPRMLAGGAIVVISLAGFLWHRRQLPIPASPAA
ncbi:DMT family transporter [Tropicibacter oceani]|uniref:DMT family transporter n=1 Tax=Tropicibacter oceani TaxID=3058420 RepID=A0ABY8QG54_9RHOB|nr:DMT family transporter [Tropicibacter oceani]WGW03167.1 DMT family transporter [Tropicibacter oceani]